MRKQEIYLENLHSEMYRHSRACNLALFSNENIVETLKFDTRYTLSPLQITTPYITWPREKANNTTFLQVE